MSALPPPPTRNERSVPMGRLLFGVLLVLLGVGWLLDSLGGIQIDWDLILPIGLIAVGVALVAAARRGEGRGGLVALGIVLTLLLTVGTVVSVPLGGGVGDRTERPLQLRDRSYELAVGKLTVDLRRAAVSGDASTIEVAARVGIGQLVVIVPQDIPCVSTHARAGLGELNVFGDTQGGIGPDYRTEAVCLAAPLLQLDLSVGLGQVEVRRG
jgi:hypothetical protein